MSDIPEEIMRAADEALLLAGLMPTIGEQTEEIARALLAAELRGRTEQIEADARNGELIAAQAYQVIGNLLDRCGAFDTAEGVRALDYFAYGPVSEDFLPWPKNGQSLENPEYTPVSATAIRSQQTTT